MRTARNKGEGNHFVHCVSRIKMIDFLNDLVGTLNIPDGRHWWGGKRHKKVIIFMEIGEDVEEEGCTGFDTVITVHGHTPYLGTACDGIMSITPNGSVNFLSDSEKVQFSGSLAGNGGFNGSISISGVDNVDIKDAPIVFDAVEN